MTKLRSKRYIILVSLVLAVILLKIDFLYLVLAFFMVGAIPGTLYSIPPVFMAAGYLFILWLFALNKLYSIKTDPSEITQQDTNLKQQGSIAQNHLPRRRYAR
jgi:hypothetical protein